MSDGLRSDWLYDFVTREEALTRLQISNRQLDLRIEAKVLFVCKKDDRTVIAIPIRPLSVFELVVRKVRKVADDLGDNVPTFYP